MGHNLFDSGVVVLAQMPQKAAAVVVGYWGEPVVAPYLWLWARK